MDQIIRQSLAGKRFGLMGFDVPEGDAIIAALGSARGIGHVIGAEPLIPGLNSFSPFDACFINATATGSGERPAPIEMIARSRKPAVIIGSFEDLVTGFAAVFDLNREFILRPCKPEELLLRTHRVLRFETAEEVIQTSAPNGSRRVVLADDDATTIVMLSTILKHFHFECDIADGEQALEIARKKRPALVLLDVSMPHMDGFQALIALRGDMATRNTPVILVSAHRDEAEVVKGFSLGADDYVTKPFNSGELIARIGRVLREPQGQ
jgi:CheY-like chemotaxis protein